MLLTPPEEHRNGSLEGFTVSGVENESCPERGGNVHNGTISTTNMVFGEHGTWPGQSERVSISV